MKFTFITYLIPFWTRFLLGSSLKGTTIPCSNEGELVSLPFLGKDSCLKCTCTGGEIVCKRQKCPDQKDCYNPEMLLDKSRAHGNSSACCGPCKGCYHHGVFHQSGSTWKHPTNSCITCKCKVSTSSCRIQSCPKLECLPSHQILEPGECCPTCYEAHEPHNVCTYRGQTYKNGETWNLGSGGNRCVTCTCNNGDVKCFYERCKILETKCRPGQKLTYKNGQCCPICLQDDVAQCSVHGDPATLYTFDGYDFKYNARCNYVLARDCSKKDFSVHLVNTLNNNRDEGINWQTNNHLTNYSMVPMVVNGNQPNNGQESSRPFNGIVVKIQNIKVRITLDEVKIGRRKVNLPHIELGVLSIFREGLNIAVRANNGVKVTWDRQNSTQVTVPAGYKNKVCGLCGNFNGNPKDDLKTKRGIRTNDMRRFFKSWKVGGHRSSKDSNILKLYRYTRYRTKMSGLKLARSLTGLC